MEFKRCDGCGRNISAELMCCPYCGHSFKTGVGIGALVGGLVLLGVAAFIGFRVHKSSGSSTDAAATGGQSTASVVDPVEDAAAKAAAEKAEFAAETARLEAEAKAERETQEAMQREEEAQQKAAEAAEKAAAEKAAQEEKLWRETRYKELFATYSKKFKSPVGREVTLGLSAGRKMKGTLKAVKPDAVVLALAKGEVEIARKDLTKTTCTMCYREEYAKRYAKIRLEKEAKERLTTDEAEQPAEPEA